MAFPNYITLSVCKNCVRTILLSFSGITSPAELSVSPLLAKNDARDAHWPWMLKGIQAETSYDHFILFFLLYLFLFLWPFIKFYDKYFKQRPWCVVREALKYQLPLLLSRVNEGCEIVLRSQTEETRIFPHCSWAATKFCKSREVIKSPILTLTLIFLKTVQAYKKRYVNIE